MEKLEEVGMYENCKEEVKEMYRKKKKTFTTHARHVLDLFNRRMP